MSDIRQWLEELGLGQHADAFEAALPWKDHWSPLLEQLDL